MKKIVIYAKEMRTMILFGGILVLMAIAIMFTWHDNHTINDHLFIVWITSMFMWAYLAKPIYQYVVSAYKIPMSEIEYMYLKAMEIEDDYHRYQALLEYHKASHKYYLHKTKQHHLGYCVVKDYENKMLKHEDAIKTLTKQVNEEKIRLSKH